MGNSEFIAEGNPAGGLASHPGSVELVLSLHATETWISYGLMGYLARMHLLQS